MENQPRNPKKTSQQILSHLDSRNGIWNHIQKLSVVTPLFGGILVVIYGIGFIIVNAYLSQFGYATYELIRGRYLGAGLSYSLTVFLMLSPLILLWKYIKHYTVKPAIIDILKLTLTFSVAFAIGFSVTVGILQVFGSFYGPSDSSQLPHPKDVLIFGAWVLLFVWYVILQYTLRASKMQGLVPVLYVVLLFLVTIFTFGVKLYPSIPAALGGGRPIKAKIILRSHIGEGKDPSLVKTRELYYSTLDRVEIIFEDERSFLLSTMKDSVEQIFLVNRDDVHQIIYQMRKKQSKNSQQKPPAPESKKEETTKK